MRTNIDIDDALMAKAMAAGPFNTKKDAVEAGLRLLARQADYREILKWQGKLKWEGDPSVDWTVPDPTSPANDTGPGIQTADRAAETPATNTPATQRAPGWGKPLPATRLRVADGDAKPPFTPPVSKRRAGR
jgi:antitoxin ParD1/3/4